MVCVTDEGTWRSTNTAVIWVWYRVSITLPMTATPNAPPTWSATVLLADPCRRLPEEPIR